MLIIVKYFLLIATTAAVVSGHKFEVGPCLLQYLEPCTSDTIQFYLFSSANPDDAPILLDNEFPVVSSELFDMRWNTKLIVHGYAGNLDFNATRAVRNGWYSNVCSFVCMNCYLYNLLFIFKRIYR